MDTELRGECTTCIRIWIWIRADELVISTSLSRARERGQGLNDPNFSSTDDTRLGVSGRKTNLVRRVKKLHSTTKVYE